MSEQFYDDEIAPELERLGKLCEDKGMSFLAIVEFSSGSVGRTVSAQPYPCAAFWMTSTAAKANGNFDALYFAAVKHSRNVGHNSLVLASAVPAKEPPDEKEM